MRPYSPTALIVAAIFLSSAQAQTQKTPPSDAESVVRPRVVAAENQSKAVVQSPSTHLTPSLIQTRIAEAKRMLRTRPVATAMTTTPQIEFVTIAALERETAKTHFVTMSKETFLTKGA